MRALIARHAPDLKTNGLPVAPERLLGALAMQESGGGENRACRFETAFYRGGRYGNAPHVLEAVNRWEQQATNAASKVLMGRMVACSWGPWQILYVTALELGFDDAPYMLGDPEVCLTWVVKLLNTRIFPKIKASEDRAAVLKIADAYNSGRADDAFIPYNYMDSVLRHYLRTDLLDGLTVLP